MPGYERTCAGRMGSAGGITRETVLPSSRRREITAESGARIKPASRAAARAKVNRGRRYEATNATGLVQTIDEQQQ